MLFLFRSFAKFISVQFLELIFPNPSPRVYEGYPYLLAEMYAYSMAAAHEKLPHLQLWNYMVSNVDRWVVIFL